MAAIQFSNVSKRFGQVVAVDQLNLLFRDKVFAVLLGPSGCGKSTTLNMVAGLDDPSEGDIAFDGEPVTYIPPHRRDVAMVFQSYALYPHKSVYDNIAFGLRMRRYPGNEIDRRVREAADVLKITELLDRRPTQLSGGQRQRVALGRAMVRQPAVFLMDEPLSNLDAGLRISMRAELKELHQRMETTFVYVTHDQAEALTLADEIVVMKDGVVQQVGSADMIYEQPQNLFVASFLGNPRINCFSGQLREDGAQTWFEGGEVRFAFPPERSANLHGCPGDRSVVLGIRPEDVEQVDVQSTGKTVSGTVSFVMPVGTDQFLCLRLQDQDAFFRVGKESRVKAGDRVTFTLYANRLHLFDGETGQSLLWS